MEFQKIIKLLDNTSNPPRGTQNTNSQIKFQTLMLNSS